MSDGRNGLTYAEAGVDIDAGNALVERIKPAAARTARPGVVAGLGGFGALFDLKAAGYADPILVAATDGVGTKLRLAIDTGRLDTVGIDLVAMCVNDLVCQGAEPLFFLDYFATGKLDGRGGRPRSIEGIAAGCVEAGAALVGGETAEMPGMYPPGDFDLAGFAVGAIERGSRPAARRRRGRRAARPASSGVHSNGYSLVRRVVEAERARLGRALARSATAASARRCSRRPASTCAPPAPRCAAGGVRGLAHITGGGLTENLPRVLPDGPRRRGRPRRLAAAAGLRVAARPRRDRRRRDAQDLQLRHRPRPRRRRRPRRCRSPRRCAAAGETVEPDRPRSPRAAASATRAGL